MSARVEGGGRKEDREPPGPAGDTAAVAAFAGEPGF